MLDLKIEGATVIDGTEAPRVQRVIGDKNQTGSLPGHGRRRA